MRITIPIVILLHTIMASPSGRAFRSIFWRRMPLQSLMRLIATSFTFTKRWTHQIFKKTGRKGVDKGRPIISSFQSKGQKGQLRWVADNATTNEAAKRLRHNATLISFEIQNTCCPLRDLFRFLLAAHRPHWSCFLFSLFLLKRSSFGQRV